jgi:hypothetical protein
MSLCLPYMCLLGRLTSILEPFQIPGRRGILNGTNMPVVVPNFHIRSAAVAAAAAGLKEDRVEKKSFRFEDSALFLGWRRGPGQNTKQQPQTPSVQP